MGDDGTERNRETGTASAPAPPTTNQHLMIVGSSGPERGPGQQPLFGDLTCGRSRASGSATFLGAAGDLW